jgi:hypothetical protein
MNEDWRFRLAQHIAAAYAADPNAEVVMIAGSVGRGAADRFSDIEVDVYYAQPPSDRARQAAVARAGAALLDMDQDPDEWAEEMGFGPFHAATSTFLVATMERYLSQTLEAAETAPLAQARIHSVLHSIPVKGSALVERWRDRAAHYPDSLAYAMLAEHLDQRRFWYAADMLAARDDTLLLHDVLLHAARKLVWALHGLNRRYTMTPEHVKWLDEMIAGLPVRPRDFGARLKQALRLSPGEAVAAMAELIEETLALVEAHEPGFSTAPFREAAHRRVALDAPPPEVVALLSRA